MGDYDFYLDGDKLSSFIETLGTFYKMLNDTVDSIYYGVDGLEVGWSGEGYDEFKQDVERFRDPLTELSIFIMAYKTILSNQITRVSTCINKVNSEFERMV